MLKGMKLLGHQGDVCIFRVDELPTEGLLVDKQGENGILAYGEASGHAHQFDVLERVEVYKSEKPELQGLRLIRVKDTVKLVHGRARDFVGKEADHDYHNPIELPPGNYVTGIVQETDWLTRTIRKVID